MMKHDQFTAIMPYISADLIAMIAEKEKISGVEALHRLYSSQLYALLEQEDTKLWHYSTHMLYSLFLQEQETGTIQFPEV